MGIKWSNLEIDTLVSYYPSIGYEGVKDLIPNRTREAITLKASRLGLKFENNIRAAKYTCAEEYILELGVRHVQLLGEYVNLTTPTLHKCCRCGLEWSPRPQAVLRSAQSSCPICSNKARYLTTDTVDKLLKGRGLQRLSEYTGVLDPILLKHECGHTYTTTYACIKDGSGCPVCNNPKTWTKELVAYLYVLSIIWVSGALTYKIGITKSSDRNKRAKEIEAQISNYIIKLKPELFIRGQANDVKAMESLLLSTAALEGCKFTSPISFSGSTELVSEKFFNRIKQIMQGREDFELLYENA